MDMVIRFMQLLSARFPDGRLWFRLFEENGEQIIAAAWFPESQDAALAVLDAHDDKKPFYAADRVNVTNQLQTEESVCEWVDTLSNAWRRSYERYQQRQGEAEIATG